MASQIYGIILLLYTYLHGNNPLLQCVKVGCLLFQRLLDGNFSSKVQLKKVLRKHFTLPENMEEEWKTDIINYYTSVTFVRHPFVRLVSAFKDKVEKILKGSLDQIPSLSPSVKIQIMGGKVCLRCKGKTLLGVVNKLLKTKSLLTSPSNVQPYYIK